MSLRLPIEKLVETRTRILEILSHKEVVLKDLQSLIGSLNFACKVVAPGRSFSRRILNATIGVTRPYYRIRVNSEMKADVRMWLEFLENYNGITFMSEQHWVSNQTLELFTDSAGGQRKGFGIYFQGQWAHGRWPQDGIDKVFLSDITFLEMFPVVVTIKIWSYMIKKNVFRVDHP